MATTDTELEALVGHLFIVGGRTISSASPGAIAMPPPRRPARGRDGDTLFGLITLGAGEHQAAAFYEELTGEFSGTYFRTSGGVTSALREALNAANSLMARRNAAAEGAAAVGLACAILRQQEVPVWSAGHDIRHCFARIAQAIDAPARRPPCSMLSALINELLVSLLNLLRSHRPRLDASLTSTERAVEIFLGELARDAPQLARPWTVPEMANRCGLGATAFTHYCRELTNETPLAHLNRLRLEHASYLLQRRPDLPIKQIASACGFATSQYFATAFRRHFGHPPRRVGQAHGG